MCGGVGNAGAADKGVQYDESIRQTEDKCVGKGKTFKSSICLKNVLQLCFTRLRTNIENNTHLL